MSDFAILKSMSFNNFNFKNNRTFTNRYTREWNRFKDELDIIKFICKEFWSAIFGKQADTLRTNHQGIYVLIDNQFRFVIKISDSPQYLNSITKVNRQYVIQLFCFYCLLFYFLVSCLLLWSHPWSPVQPGYQRRCYSWSFNASLYKISNTNPVAKLI